MSFLNTSFDYYSKSEEITDLAIGLVIGGATIYVGGLLLWLLMMEIGLTTGTKNIYECVTGKDVFIREDLSGSRGIMGVLDYGLAAYGGHKGVKSYK